MTMQKLYFNSINHYTILKNFSLCSVCLGGMPRFSIAAAAANMAQYLSQNQGAPLKHSGALVDRTHLYWPGLQGLVANPMAWRDRLGSSEFNEMKGVKFFFSVFKFVDH